MGFGGISIWQLLIILLIVVVIFGTKKLRNMGSDVGSAVKNFKDAMKDEDDKDGKGEHKRISSEDDSSEDRNGKS